MARMRTALQILALSASTFATACGDGERQLSASPSFTEVGGNASDAGTANTHAGGNSTTFSRNTTGGAVALDAGTTGGDAAVADSGATGGASNGGTSSVGGTTNSGSGAAGDSSIGGSGAGGTSATAASSVGGITSLGGDSSTGGVATGGTSAGLSCVASCVTPTNNQALANADDLNGTCSDGIQYNVVIATNAPDGTAAVLSLTLGSGDTTQIAGTTVSSAIARFSNVTLPASGQVTLAAAIGGNACSATETLTLSCAGAPGCTITSPAITAAHPALNGVAATQGDRVSSVGSPYQVAFEVSTDAQDGQSVVLTVDGNTNYQTTVSAGKARFAGVLMASDGNHTAQAMCTARSGLSSTSSLLTFPVDTVAPDLTPQKGTGTGGSTISTLNNNDHYALADDADLGTNGLQIKVCGATNATDAVDIASANPNANNFCVKRGSSASVCAAVASNNSNSAGNFACVAIDCPGAGPFSLDLSMSDAAGNPTTVTRTGITCASTSPTVNIIDPQSDSGAFSDISKRILAADNNNPQTVRKDKNASKAGAQYDVLACTTAPPGSTAILYTGYKGQTLIQTATATVTADSATTPVCSGGNLITFSSNTVTLPESLTDTSFNIATPTELKVSVTDLNLAVGSDTADVWVDSVSPSLTLVTPSPFCGHYFDTSGTGSSTASVNMTFGSSIPVVVSVAGTSGTQTFSNNTPVFSQVTVAVQLEAGTDSVSAKATMPSTNYGTYPACDVTVGVTPPPSVSWQTPLNTSLLTATGNKGTNKIPDSNASTGWQGTLKVCTNVNVATYSSATVTFTATVGDTVTSIGSANIVADGSCPTGTTSSATLANATVPEGDNVLLTATTSTIGASTGTASISVPVSSTVPGQPAITGVDITDRRRTSFTPKWTAPSGSVAGYKVRVSKTPIAAQSDFDGALDIPYSGSGACPEGGCSVLVDNCYIENNYYFAVAAVDSVGNVGPYVATNNPTRATFNQIPIVAPTPGQRFGYVFDGSSDLNGDGFTDLLVGYSNGLEVYIYFGSATGLPSTPSVTIRGTASAFGQSVAVIGDINNDTHPDIAIGSPREGNGVVYVYLGRSSWPATLTATAADCVINVNASTETGYSSSFFGFQVAGIGDFNGDNIDDFAVTAPFFNGMQGHVTVIYGNSGSFGPSISLPSAFGTAATRIDGDAAFQGGLGISLTGLGKSYGSGSFSMLVTSAPYGPPSASSGRLYALSGQTGVPASIDISTAVATADGAAGTLYGSYQLLPLGNVANAAQSALGINVPSKSRGDVRGGTMSTGPFVSSLSIGTTDSNTTYKFGVMFIGGGFSGQSARASVVGSSQSDILVTTTAGIGPRLFIVDGSKITYGSSVQVENVADVTFALPGTWTDFTSNATLLKDINNDGYADIGVAETTHSATLIDGKMLVLY